MSNRTNRSNRSAHGKPRKAKPRPQHGTALKRKRIFARQHRFEVLEREAQHLCVLSELYAQGLSVIDRKNRTLRVVVRANPYRAEAFTEQARAMAAKAKEARPW